VRVVETGVDVREAQSEIAEAVEDVAVHEGRPALAREVRSHGVVVDVPV
jgi:hypothetical protein